MIVASALPSRYCPSQTPRPYRSAPAPSLGVVISQLLEGRQRSRVSERTEAEHGLETDGRIGILQQRNQRPHGGAIANITECLCRFRLDGWIFLFASQRGDQAWHGA